MASPYLLQCALRDALTPMLEKFPLATRLQGDASEAGEVEGVGLARIYLADLPKRTKNEAERAPFICLQEQSGRHIDSMEQVDIILRLVVFSHDVEHAAQELSNFVHAVRFALMPYVTAPLDKRFRLIMSKQGQLLPYECPLEQNAPYAEAFVLSTWDYKGFEFNTAKGV